MNTQATLTGISNGVLIIILVIAVEVMLFGGLISAFLIQSLGTAIWPPPGQPVLNNIVTHINTAFLILSGISIQLVLYFIGKKRISKALFLLTIVLGSMFLLIQGYEWLNLISFGFTTVSSNLGSFFYVIIGIHALHVFVGLISLIYTYIGFINVRYDLDNHVSLDMVRLYWSFVVLLWPIFYSLIYFN